MSESMCSHRVLQVSYNICFFTRRSYEIPLLHYTVDACRHARFFYEISNLRNLLTKYGERSIIIILRPVLAWFCFFYSPIIPADDRVVNNILCRGNCMPLLDPREDYVSLITKYYIYIYM